MVCTSIKSTCSIIIATLLFTQARAFSSFQTRPRPASIKELQRRPKKLCSGRVSRLQSSLMGEEENPTEETTTALQGQQQEQYYTHDDIDWKLICSTPDCPSDERIRYPIPFLEYPIPSDGKVTLEAWLKNKESNDNNKRNDVKVGRFGLTVTAGPPHVAIFETIQQLQAVDSSLEYGTAAAIIYMFVEEEYRKRGIGELALEVLSWIHAKVDCYYTVLVADDNGTGKLVEWYETHGFSKAPLLQDLLGSPDGVYGITMIAPTSTNHIPEDFKIFQKEE